MCAEFLYILYFNKQLYYRLICTILKSCDAIENKYKDRKPNAIKILIWSTRVPHFSTDFWDGFRLWGSRRKWIFVARTAANYHSGNEYFVINFVRFHCSNCEHFRPAGAKPHSVTINYDGVMPLHIYYAAHWMSCQIIPIRLQSSFVPLARASKLCKGLLTLAMN